MTAHARNLCLLSTVRRLNREAEADLLEMRGRVLNAQKICGENVVIASHAAEVVRDCIREADRLGNAVAKKLRGIEAELAGGEQPHNGLAGVAAEQQATCPTAPALDRRITG
jgi:hypothetical protein